MDCVTISSLCFHNLRSLWEAIVVSVQPTQSFFFPGGLQHHLYHCGPTFNLKRFCLLFDTPQNKGIQIIDQFAQEPNWSMRYIIKRRLLIRAEARWVKCLLQRRGPDQLCCQCSWIGPHVDQCVIEPYGSAHCSLSFCGRRGDWKSDSQRYKQRTRFCHFCSYGIEATPPGVWRGPTLRSSITAAQWCTIKNGGEHVKKDELCHLSLLRSVFDLSGPTLDSACGDYIMMTFVCDHQDQTENGGIVTEFLWQSSFKSQQTDLP